MPTNSSGITFDLWDVDIAQTTYPSLPMQFVLEGRLKQSVEAFGWSSPYLVDFYNTHLYYTSDDSFHVSAGDFCYLHPFVEAVHYAFAEHYPLSLSPDHVWLVLCQGFANHIHQHSEGLREKVVAHEGKVTIEVRDDTLVKGSLYNDWQGVIAQVVDQMRPHLGDLTDTVTAEFSTTTPVEQMAFNITLMHAMQEYFDVFATSLCGIPRITLEGTVEDWRALLRRFEAFRHYDLSDWVARVVPLLEQFIQAAEGNVDRAFWNNLYKVNNESGGPYINGWITDLFPYLSSYGTITRNNHLMDDGPFSGVTIRAFPPELFTAPFTWKYMEQRLSMTLVGGFVGVTQDTETLALRPAIGWGVMGPDSRPLHGHAEVYPQRKTDLQRMLAETATYLSRQ